jgi:hypothetical protein
MNFSNWYNGNTDYPALQVIYPDLQNRFQWEEGFENRFTQPLLQPDAPWTTVDQRFWDSTRRDTERFPLSRFLEKPVPKAEAQSLHVCTTWWTKIRLSQNSLISQKDGTQRE